MPILSSGPLAVAYLNTFTFACVQMILYTTIPYIAETTFVPTATIIAAISVGSLIFSGMGPFWAAKSDRLGRKKVLSFGMLGMAISFACLATLFIFNEQLSLAFKVLLVFSSRIIYGLLASAVVPVSQAWQLDLTPTTEKVKVLTRNSMCLNLGRILGPILILFKQVDFEFVIYSASFWVIILATSNFLYGSMTPAQTASKQVDFKVIVASWKRSIHESLYPILLAMIFTSFIGVLHSFLGHHLKNTLSIDGSAATLMFAKIILVLSVLAIMIQQLGIIIMKSNWRPRAIIGSSAIVIGSFIMMNSTTESTIWVSIGFIAIATAFLPPVYLALTSNSRENKADENVFGKKLGLASVAHSFGYALGMGLIALSLKIKIISSSLVVYTISASILILCLFMVMRNTSGSVQVAES